jgi:hypothetical protein
MHKLRRGWQAYTQKFWQQATPQGGKGTTDEKKEAGNRYVAVEVEGEVFVHAHDATGNYATLCGLDGDDPRAGQRPAQVPLGAKISCHTCQKIIVMSRKYTKKDFA